MRLSAVVLAVCCVWCGLPLALAQDYPTKPVTLVVPFAPGGTNDLVGRPLAQKLAEALGKPIVVENRGGAGGTIGTARVVAAPPDGYTLLIGSAGPLGTAPGYYPKLSYDPVTDLAPVSEVMSSPIILLVNPVVPARTVHELIALAKRRPGQLNYGSPGTGSMNHLAGELFDMMAKVRLVHVPYKGSGPAVVDLIAGRLDLMFAPVAPTLPYVKAGKLRAIAVGSEHRFKILPDLPTIREAGVPGYDVSQWWGIAAPAKTPEPIVRKLNAAIGKILDTKEIQDLYTHLGGQPASGSAADFGNLIRREVSKWREVLQAAHISAGQ
jgi:tripartite-type tricarboxylate transporter receptor subunit TctC